MKAVTLLGMSGAGKTHFSQRLAAWGWTHYSCDFEIAKILGIDVSVDDLSALSAFIGQVGDPEKGGLPVKEFKRRQRLYYDAEVEALSRVCSLAEARFVNDATGSFCEIEDEGLIAQVAKATRLVYIETAQADHDAIVERAKAYPKPLYFPSDAFDGWLEAFCEVHKVGPEGVEPHQFSAWVFPKLFESRLPKYARIAKDYGVTVPAADLHAVEDEQEFLDLIG